MKKRKDGDDGLSWWSRGWDTILLPQEGFPGGSVGKETTYNAEDFGLTPWSGRSPGGGRGNPLQDSCLENPMDREALQATVRGVTKSQTGLKQLSTRTHMQELRFPVLHGVVKKKNQ